MILFEDWCGHVAVDRHRVVGIRALPETAGQHSCNLLLSSGHSVVVLGSLENTARKLGLHLTLPTTSVSQG